MKYARTFVSAVLAGFAIGLGGVIFLSLENKVMGAALFTVGLFTVCTMGLHLFTGKVCYLFQNGKEYAMMLPVIWLGNFCGAGVTAFFASMTRIAGIAEKAASLCAFKTADSPVSLFFLGLLCNIFIYLAVEGFKSIPHEVGKYLALIFGVMGFILCGTEHCVADMFYFWMAGAWNAHAFACLLTITLGNAVGGVLLPLARSFANGKN